jgi:glycoside/pentoside/hexuronide:cation symporter, GPH family
MAEFLILTTPTNMAVPVYSNHYGMDTGMLGSAKAAARLMAAFSDSIMGSFSDNAQTRWGRRRPFILVGAALCAIMMPWMWTLPTQSGNVAMFIYVSVMMSIYTMLYSLFYVPYQALGLELTTDYDERTRIQAWKGYMSGIAFFFPPWFIWFCSLDFFPDIVTGTRWLCSIMGAVVLIGALLTVIFCRERTAEINQKKIPIIPSLTLTFKNRPFRLLQGAVFAIGSGLNLGSTAGFYLLLDYVCQGDMKAFALLAGVNGTVCNLMTYAGMVLGVWISTHYGKRVAGLTGIALILVGTLAVIPFLAPHYTWLPIIPAIHHKWLTIFPGIIMNLGLQISNLMFASMLADVCDEDELKTNMRREGSYVAVAGILTKFMGVTMLIIGGFIPYLSGYQDMSIRPSEAQLISMKNIIIGGQATATVVAFIFIFVYPITRARAEEVRRQLNSRQPKTLEGT